MKWTAPLAAVIAAQLALGVVGVVIVEAPKPAELGPYRSLEPIEKPSPLAPLVEEISRFVETSRGLKFKHSVKATLLDDKTFGDTYSAGSDADDPGYLIDRTLGFINPNASADEAAAAAADDVLGFYDAVHDELFVRGADPTPFVRMVLAHEITHALQDQHFGLYRGRKFGLADESNISLEALAEGDAMRVQRAYFNAMSVDDQRAIQDKIKADREADNAAAVATQNTPQWPGDRASEYLSVFPYQTGQQVVARLIERGGQAELDGNFRSPPTSTNQLINPGTPLPVAVATPPSDGDKIAEGPMGVLLLYAFLMAQWNGPSWYGGWTGGRYVAWKQGNDACVRFTVHLDTGYNAASLAESLRRVADLHGNSSVSGPSFPRRIVEGQVQQPPANAPVTYTTCGLPQTRTYDQAQARMQAYAKRNQVTYVTRPYPTYQPYTPPTYQPYTPPTLTQPTTPPYQPPKCDDVIVVQFCE